MQRTSSQQQYAWEKDMHDNMYIQKVAKDSSKSRERESSISETFVRLNVLDYKKAEQSDQVKRSNWDSTELIEVAHSKVGRF